MRVLSVSQPWAQLIVRGIKVRERRSWGTSYRGRIAIHAASKAPAFNTAAEVERNISVAAWFAVQEWHTRDDLVALPRSAIVGTVEIRDVQRAPLSDEGDDTGEWIFTLSNPVEIPALGEIAGKQRLWTLDDIASREVLHREAASGSAPSGDAPSATQRAGGARGDAVVARLKRQLERRQQAERERFVRMPTSALERRFQRMFDAYCAANRAPGLTPELEPIRIVGNMRKWFVSATVPRVTLERLLRVELYDVAADSLAHPRRPGVLDWSFYNNRRPDAYDEGEPGVQPRFELKPTTEDGENARRRRMKATRDVVFVPPTMPQPESPHEPLDSRGRPMRPWVGPAFGPPKRPGRRKR